MNYTKNYTKENLLKVSIRLDSLGYTQISKSEKTTFENLISSIGGTLGCFLGASLLSLVEIGEVMLNLAFIWIEHLKKFIKK